MIIHLPYRRWAGVSGSGSSISDHTYVNGWLFKSASISAVIVCNVERLTKACPNTFLTAFFVRPIRLSQNPPNHSTCLGMNCRLTPCLFKVYLRESDRNSSLTAAEYVDALSDIMVYGSNLRFTNLLNAWRKFFSVRSVTTSRWVAAQVKRQMYTFTSLSLPRTYSAPVKSTPVVVKD